MENTSHHRLRDIFTRQIRKIWDIYSTDQVLYSHQLSELQDDFHTFFSHQVVSITERMSIHQSPFKVRFTSSPYKHAFLWQLHRKVLDSKRVEIQYAIEEFCYYCLENIYQHAGTKGYAFIDVTDRDIVLIFFDKGPGMADVDADGIPDILEAIKPKTSLIYIGSKGMGLTKAIRLADDFHLYSNGFFWDKADPKVLHKTEFYIEGVCIVARISYKTAIMQPRRYMMV